MFSLNGNVFSGRSTLGVGSVGGLGAAVLKGSAESCPSGTIEFGSPSRCGSKADYDQYVQSTVAAAFGGSTEKAKDYLQTTQYGVENNYGCDYPNYKTVDAAGKSMCLSPTEAVKAGFYTTCPKGTTKSKDGECVKDSYASGGSSGSGTYAKPAPAPAPSPAPAPAPPVSQSSISPMAIAAVVLGVGAIGAIIYKVRKDKNAKGGMSPNEYGE